MSSPPRLYAIIKVEFPHTSNPYIIQEQLEGIKDMIYDELSDKEGARIPCVDVTYETVLEVPHKTTVTERT